MNLLALFNDLGFKFTKNLFHNHSFNHLKSINSRITITNPNLCHKF